MVIPKNVCPYKRGMERWGFKRLEKYILEKASEYLKEYLEQGKNIRYIEVVNYSKGWIYPITWDYDQIKRSGLLIGKV